MHLLRKFPIPGTAKRKPCVRKARTSLGCWRDVKLSRSGKTMQSSKLALHGQDVPQCQAAKSFECHSKAGFTRFGQHCHASRTKHMLHRDTNNFVERRREYRKRHRGRNMFAMQNQYEEKFHIHRAFRDFLSAIHFSNSLSFVDSLELIPKKTSSDCEDGKM